MRKTLFGNLALLGLTSTLLAACGPNNSPVVDPVDPAAVAPAAPVVGQAQDWAQLSTTMQSASSTLKDMTTPGSADADPILAELLSMLSGQMSGLSLNAQPTQLGRNLLAGLTAGRLGGHGPLGGTLQTQGLTDVPLPTGTVTIDANGAVSMTTTPTDGYVIDNKAKGIRMEYAWHVGGAPSTWVSQRQGLVVVRYEVPTAATASATKNGTPVAAATLNMTPGDCPDLMGPTALKVSAWAGKQAAPAAQTNVDYAWTDSGITAKASGAYATKTRASSANINLSLNGTTANRCSPLSFAFTPTRLDFTGNATLPNQQADATLYLRDLKNVVITADVTQAANPFKAVEGNLNANLKYNGAVALSAFGPIQDGNDLDLLPGDQVKVQYVKGGKLIETDLISALKDLFR